ncbi:hypothetical protein BJH93_15485 [Kocuria polaris]|nr:hypothetical protein [Kocuria polaris]
MARIEVLRRENKWSVPRFAFELGGHGIPISARTVGCWFVKLGINRRRRLLPDGESPRKPARRIIAGHPGHMVHLDVKKTHRIPGSGGWFAHGRDSGHARAAECAKAKTGTKPGYVY